jgi:hypothetical protein
MKRSHALAVAVLLALAAAIGVVAVTKASHAATSARRTASSALVAARTRQLDRVELQLRRALKDRPPALPALPAARPAQPASPHVVYQRPAPVIVINHRPHHDDEEGDSESGDD